MESKKENPEPKANSSDEEVSFESADEGDDGGIEKAATSADMRSEHSTSKVVKDMEEEIQAEITAQESSDQIEPSEKPAEAAASSVLESAAETPRQRGEEAPDESKPTLSAEAPDGGKDAMKGAGAENETKEIPLMSVKSELKSESKSEEPIQTEYTNRKMGSKSSVETDVTEEPDKGHCESSTNNTKPDVKEPGAAQGGWGWGGWLSQATASVTSGLTSVIETVESSLGVPDPNEMAKKVKEEEEQAQKDDSIEEERDSKDHAPGTEGTGTFLSSFGVSTLTNVVQNKGMELVTGGLDALELIGKRTMDALSEGDVGLRENRVQLLSKGPTLSQVLKEGKEASEAKARRGDGQDGRRAAAVDVFTKFEEHQGMAHLEALEILSHECEAKVESQMIDSSAEDLNVLKPVLRAVEEMFHIEEDDDDDDNYDANCEEGDFESKVVENLSAVDLNVRPDKLVSTQKLGKEWLDACVEEQDSKPGNRTGQEIYEAAVGTMGELTARTVEMFHKVAELILFQGNKCSETSAVVRVQCLRKLTDTVSRESASLAMHFAGCLNTAANDAEDPDSINPLITNIYLDSSTSTSYLRNSYKLLCPVLQLSALNEKRTEAD